MRQSESGNALFYILIAVALLAALGFAIAQSGRGSVSALSEERQRLLASEILDYAGAVKKAVQMMRLRGIVFSDLDFDDPGLAGHDNPGCASDECLIFNVAGGGMVYKQASPDSLESAADWVFAANNEIGEIGTTAGDASSADLLMILRPLKKEVCARINIFLGIPNPSGDPPEDADIDMAAPYTGAAAYSKTVGDEAGASKLGPGQDAACFREVSSGDYTFYQVLLPR